MKTFDASKRAYRRWQQIFLSKSFAAFEIFKQINNEVNGRLRKLAVRFLVLHAGFGKRTFVAHLRWF
ncbi:MAG TPA: hypothetical protein VH229_02565, partial [Candidatus Udaeobacter sp.]|nr:hypothetical protein [Candidatus Udaeobacter sp.]